MSRFLLTSDARMDLADILFYVSGQSPAAAQRLLDEIYEACEKLAEMPGIGHFRDDFTKRPVRFWRVQSYQIVYRTDTTPIQIMRILSSYRDLASLLG
jgi:plasmid stabilization system protein ParE